MKKILLISIGLFIISLTQKAYCTESLCADSLAVFIMGPLGFAFPFATLVWLANPILLISWIKIYKNRKESLIASFLATLIALSFLLFNKIVDDEAGHYRNIIGYQSGYWLWVLSSGVMFIGNLVYAINSKLIAFSISFNK